MGTIGPRVVCVHVGTIGPRAGVCMWEPLDLVQVCACGNHWTLCSVHVGITGLLVVCMHVGTIGPCVVCVHVGTICSRVLITDFGFPEIPRCGEIPG